MIYVLDNFMWKFVVCHQLLIIRSVIDITGSVVHKFLKKSCISTNICYKFCFLISGNTGTLVFNDVVSSVRTAVSEIQANDSSVNIIIAVGHAGFTLDKQIAKEVDGVDIVVGGHTNTFLYTGRFRSILTQPFTINIPPWTQFQLSIASRYTINKPLVASLILTKQK